VGGREHGDGSKRGFAWCGCGCGAAASGCDHGAATVGGDRGGTAGGDGLLTVDFGTPSYKFTVNICTYLIF
jgi:hypothetical protein